MIAWQQGRETFCHYCTRRQQQRQQWIATLRGNAQNEYSARLAEKLAQAWRIN